MADAQEQARKEQLDHNRKLTEDSRKEAAERLRGKPTPTQEENDRAKLGEHIAQHEDDGSGPDPFDERNREALRGTSGGTVRHVPGQPPQRR
jgi:hypothetical protein